jgi:hypothetical protein
MAFQSIKKLLPDSCICMNNGLLEGLMEGVVRPPLTLPHGYLKFVRRTAARIFPNDWDVSYREHCYTTSPPLSSTLESSRAKGGGLNTAMTQSEFLEETLGTSRLSSSSNVARPMVVQSAGKPRPLTKFSEDCLTLKPLHKALYDRISHLGWVCRGDVTAEKLDRAGFLSGRGSLVSGDYKSATDNLPLEVAEEILRVALSRATRVPEGISEYALKVLRPLFLYRGEEVEVVSGQQMGSLLSFPLLCVQNYIAFRWAVRCHFGSPDPQFPVLINGDDILFQCVDPCRSFYASWIRVVGDVGLEVERTKTSVDEDYGSLNSTLLRWKAGQLRVVPTLRFGLLRRQSYANALPRSLQQFALPGLQPDIRYRAGVEFVLWHLPTLLRTNLAPHELGFSGRFAWRVLHKGGALRMVKRRLDENPAESLCKTLPSLPCPHNVIMTSDDVEWVSSLTREEERMNCRELAAWKWRKVGSFRKGVETLELRYWLGLSRLPVDVSRLYRLSESRREVPGWYRRVKDAYFAPRQVVEKKVFLMRGIDRLPTYDEAVRLGDITLDVAPPEVYGKYEAAERKQLRHLELLELLPGR